MTPEFEYGTLANPEDIQRLGYILDQCFITPAGDSEGYINKVGAENLRIIRKSGEIAGGLAILSMGQYFGGCNVPMAGIAAVGIGLEYRGTGSAIALLQHTLKELYANGIPISTLYPATQRLYRKAGYEQGGSSCVWEISAQDVQLRVDPLDVQAVDPKNLEAFYHLYNRQAKQIDGYLDRNQFIWNQVSKPFEQERLYAYLIGANEGYIIFSQDRTEDNSFLRVRDWVLLTNRAVQTFWYLIANHRSQIEKVRWKSSVLDSLTLPLPEQTAKIKHSPRWMLRVVDVVKALEKRGYPLLVQGSLHLQVQDDAIAENNGKFILSVANGRGEVTRGGGGDLLLDVRELASIYTGLFTPYQLAIALKLEGTESALSLATEIFAGASPWMADFF